MHHHYNAYSNTNTNYADPIVFINSTCETSLVNLSHGIFVKNGSTWTTEIHLKDHLGNTPMAVFLSGSSFSIAQKNFYYPFGMLKRSGNPVFTGRISTLSTNPISLGTTKTGIFTTAKSLMNIWG